MESYKVVELEMKLHKAIKRIEQLEHRVVELEEYTNKLKNIKTEYTANDRFQ